MLKQALKLLRPFLKVLLDAPTFLILPFLISETILSLYPPSKYWPMFYKVNTVTGLTSLPGCLPSLQGDAAPVPPPSPRAQGQLHGGGPGPGRPLHRHQPPGQQDNQPQDPAKVSRHHGDDKKLRLDFLQDLSPPHLCRYCRRRKRKDSLENLCKSGKLQTLSSQPEPVLSKRDKQLSGVYEDQRHSRLGLLSLYKDIKSLSHISGLNQILSSTVLKHLCELFMRNGNPLKLFYHFQFPPGD